MRASSCASREGGLRGANIHLPSASSPFFLFSRANNQGQAHVLCQHQGALPPAEEEKRKGKNLVKKKRNGFSSFFSSSTSGYFRGAETKTKICLSVFPNGISLSRGENILRTFLLLFLLAAETARNHKDNLPQ